MSIGQRLSKGRNRLKYIYKNSKVLFRKPYGIDNKPQSLEQDRDTNSTVLWVLDVRVWDSLIYFILVWLKSKY